MSSKEKRNSSKKSPGKTISRYHPKELERRRRERQEIREKKEKEEIEKFTKAYVKQYDKEPSDRLKKSWSSTYPITTFNNSSHSPLNEPLHKDHKQIEKELKQKLFSRGGGQLIQQNTQKKQQSYSQEKKQGVKQEEKQKNDYKQKFNEMNAILTLIIDNQQQIGAAHQEIKEDIINEIKQQGDEMQFTTKEVAAKLGNKLQNEIRKVGDKVGDLECNFNSLKGFLKCLRAIFLLVYSFLEVVARIVYVINKLPELVPYPFDYFERLFLILVQCAVLWIICTLISPHFRNAVFKNGSKLVAEILYQLVYGIYETIKVCIGGTSDLLDFPEMFRIIGKEFEPLLKVLSIIFMNIYYFFQTAWKNAGIATTRAAWNCAEGQVNDWCPAFHNNTNWQEPFEREGGIFGGSKTDELLQKLYKEFDKSEGKKKLDKFKEDILKQIDKEIDNTDESIKIPENVKENFQVFKNELKNLFTALDNTLDICKLLIIVNESKASKASKVSKSLKSKLVFDVPKMIVVNPLQPVPGVYGGKKKNQKSKTKKINKNKKNKTSKRNISN